jgi:hypothetical protein
MRREILKRANPIFIESKFLIDIIRPVLANADLGLGFSSNGTQYNSIAKLYDDFDIHPTLLEINLTLNEISEKFLPDEIDDLKELISHLMEVYPNAEKFNLIRSFELPVQVGIADGLSLINNKFQIPNTNSLKEILQKLRIYQKQSSDFELKKYFDVLQRRFTFDAGLDSALAKINNEIEGGAERSKELFRNKIDGILDTSVTNPEASADASIDAMRVDAGVPPLGVAPQIKATNLQRKVTQKSSQAFRTAYRYAFENNVTDIEELVLKSAELGVRLTQADIEQLDRSLSLLRQPDELEGFEISPEDELRSQEELIRAEEEREALREAEREAERELTRPQRTLSELQSKSGIPASILSKPVGTLSELQTKSGIPASIIPKRKKPEPPKEPEKDDFLTPRQVYENIIKLKPEDIQLAYAYLDSRVNQRELTQEQVEDLKRNVTFVRVDGDREPQVIILFGEMEMRNEAQAMRQFTVLLGYLEEYIEGLNAVPKGAVVATKVAPITIPQAVPQKPKNKVKNYEEGEEHFKKFVEELETRTEEDQIYLLRNLIAKAEQEMKNPPERKEINKHFRQFGKGGRQDLIDILEEYYQEKVIKAEEKGKEYTSRSFGVSKQGYTTKKPLEYGLGVVKPPKIGKGVEAPKREPYKTFGKYLIHIPSLEDNVANFKYPSRATIPHIKRKQISNDYTEFLKDLMQNSKINEKEYNRLCDEEREHFNTVTKGAGLSEMLKVKAPKKNTDDLARYELLIGEFKAGNNSPVMLKELRALIIKFMDEGKIKRKDGQSLLVDLSV